VSTVAQNKGYKTTQTKANTQVTYKSLLYTEPWVHFIYKHLTFTELNMHSYHRRRMQPQRTIFLLIHYPLFLKWITMLHQDGSIGFQIPDGIIGILHWPNPSSPL